MHPDFRLFATQNPNSGLFKGKREALSQSFLSRFLPVTFEELPRKDWIDIIGGKLIKDINGMELTGYLRDFLHDGQRHTGLSFKLVEFHMMLQYLHSAPPHTAASSTTPQASSSAVAGAGRGRGLDEYAEAAADDEGEERVDDLNQSRGDRRSARRNSKTIRNLIRKFQRPFWNK